MAKGRPNKSLKPIAKQLTPFSATSNYTLENKQADEFANEVLFNKLGISEFSWEKENSVLCYHSELHLKPYVAESEFFDYGYQW